MGKIICSQCERTFLSIPEFESHENACDEKVKEEKAKRNEKELDVDFLIKVFNNGGFLKVTHFRELADTHPGYGRNKIPEFLQIKRYDGGDYAPDNIIERYFSLEDLKHSIDYDTLEVYIRGEKRDFAIQAFIEGRGILPQES